MYTNAVYIFLLETAVQFWSVGIFIDSTKNQTSLGIQIWLDENQPQLLNHSKNNTLVLNSSQINIWGKSVKIRHPNRQTRDQYIINIDIIFTFILTYFKSNHFNSRNFNSKIFTFVDRNWRSNAPSNNISERNLSQMFKV